MPSDEALDLLRQHYSETEAWKVAQIAATLTASWLGDPDAMWGAREAVEVARDLLDEARRQVGTETAPEPRAFTAD